MRSTTKIVLLLLVLTLLTTTFYILNSPYRMKRIAQWFEPLHVEKNIAQTKSISEDKNSTQPRLKTIIINRYDGVVTDVTKTTVTVKSSKDNTLVKYRGFKRVAPHILVGKKVSHGLILGRGFVSTPAPTEKSISLRGSIITDDNVTLAYSQKVYHLSVLGGYYNEKEFFELFKYITMIKDIKDNSIKKRYFKNDKAEYKIVAYAFNEEEMLGLKTLFEKNKIKKYAFVLSGEQRVYPYKDMLTPVIGYTRKLIGKDNLTYLKGVQGVEKEYENYLSCKKRVPQDIRLSINFELQTLEEFVADEMKSSLLADEVITMVLDTDSFKIRALTSSNRYDPKDIKRDDFSKLNIHAKSYKFKLGEFARPLKSFRDKEVDFIQLVELYSSFYNSGKTTNARISSKNTKIFTQIMSQEEADKTQKTLYNFFELMQEVSFNFNYNDTNLSATIVMQELEYNNKKHIEAYFIINAKKPYSGGEHVEIEVPKGFPYAVTEISYENVPVTYIIHSKEDKNDVIAKITQILTRYQATNGQGRETVADGIYSDKEGNFYIDRLTSEGKEMATCNACQEYFVETLQISEDGISSVYKRDYNSKTYKKYKE